MQGKRIVVRYYLLWDGDFVYLVAVTKCVWVN